MNIEELSEEKAENRTWHLTLLSVVIILYLTLVIVSIHFYGEGNSALGGVGMKYTVALSLLILLFCAYMIVTHRKISKFTKAITRSEKMAQALSRNVEMLSSLIEISSSINSEQKLCDILDIITKEMLACFHADRSSIMLLDEQTQMLRVESSCGAGSELARDAQTPVGKGIAGWVVANSKPLLLNGRVDERRFPGTARKSRPISSSLCVPLKLADRSIGVLTVNLMAKERVFTETDLQLLTIFANNAAVAIHNSMLRKEKDLRIQLETMLGQLHSPQVVRQLMDRFESGARPNKMREEVELTILFSDIRGFTNMLNQVEPEDLMNFLDEFYSVMNKAVFDNEGSIDKFIGDEVMAFFGAPIPLPNSTQNGLATAVEMMYYFKDLQERYARRSEYFGRLGLGIGMNTGAVVVGNVGSTLRYEYTVIGSAVNLARRLCAHAQPGQILASERTLERVDADVPSMPLEEIHFKGIPGAVRVRSVLWKKLDIHGKATMRD